MYTPDPAKGPQTATWRRMNDGSSRVSLDVQDVTLSFGGVAALLSMLNSCASNVVVVNIDAGFKAAYVAGMIAKRTRPLVNDEDDSRR